MSRFFSKTHIYEVEYRCQCCGKLPPYFYVKVGDEKEISIEYVMLFSAFEEIRKQLGKPIVINSGYRCEKHQMYLYKNGISLTPYSTHFFGLALDLKAKDKDEAMKIVKIAKTIKPKLRIGWKAYIEKERPWVHIDVGYLICPKFSKKLREEAEW